MNMAWESRTGCCSLGIVRITELRIQSQNMMLVLYFIVGGDEGQTSYMNVRIKFYSGLG